MFPDSTGLKEISFTPCGTSDDETCTAGEIEKGGIFIVPQAILFVQPLEPTSGCSRIEQYENGSLLTTWEVPPGMSEWRGHVTLARGNNLFRFVQFGEEDYSLTIYHRTWLSELIVSIVRALILLTLIQTFIIQTYQIPSSSMEPAFLPGDYVLVEKLTYAMREPEKKEIVVFEFPPNFQLDFVKRVVATSGEEVILNNKQLYVDGKAVDERRFAEYREWKPFSGDNLNRSYGPVTVPDESYLVFGDNRDNSYDSRGWGPLPAGNVSGKPWLIYWPPSRAGFVEGRKK